MSDVESIICETCKQPFQRHPLEIYKTMCVSCYRKSGKKSKLANAHIHEAEDAKCDSCGSVFVREKTAGWKTLCRVCYLKSIGEYFDPVVARERTLSGSILELDHWVYCLTPDGGLLSGDMNSEDVLSVKIGRSRNFKNRFADIQRHNHDRLDVILTIPIEKGYNMESELHKMFAESRIHGEWFRLRVKDMCTIMGMFSPDYPWEVVTATRTVSTGSFEP